MSPFRYAKESVTVQPYRHCEPREARRGNLRALRSPRRPAFGGTPRDDGAPERLQESWIFLIFFLCFGCASSSSPPPLLEEHPSGTASERVYLTDQSQILPDVSRFYASRDLTTEEGKIDYLIERVQKSKVIFIRNRVEYTSIGAAQFLRWKLGRLRNHHHISIETAQDFVHKVAGGSRVSGQPYTVVLEDGRPYDMGHLIQNELDMLESCLKNFPNAPSRSG